MKSLSMKVNRLLNIEQDIYEEAGCEETETCGSDDSDSDTQSSTDYEGYVSSDNSLPLSDDDQADLLQFEAELRYSLHLIALAYFVGKNIALAMIKRERK